VLQFIEIVVIKWKYAAESKVRNCNQIHSGLTETK